MATETFTLCQSCDKHFSETFHLTAPLLDRLTFQGATFACQMCPTIWGTRHVDRPACAVGVDYTLDTGSKMTRVLLAYLRACRARARAGTVRDPEANAW